jgi:hypothetical protein
MSELRSAWEIAQERASRLGKLSPEEKAEQARKGHRDAGQALAQKWLDSSQRLDIAAELNKYPQRERDSIKQALIEHLVEGAELTTTRGVDNAKKVARAISSLKPELEPRAAELDQLVQEYEKAEQKISQELDTTRRQRLHQLRISGTAVDTLNIEASPRWRLAREKLLETFTPRLNDLKQSLGR